MIIIAQYSGACISCGEEYESGQSVNWEKGHGCWHTTCRKPQSIALEQREQQKAVKLGLQAPEFGQAPMLRDRDE